MQPDTLETDNELAGGRAVATAPRPKDAGRRYRFEQSALDVLVIFLVVQVGSVAYALISPRTFAYLHPANIQTALRTIPLVGILALGMGVLLICGEFDLSLGANLIFTSILMAQLTQSGVSVWVAALLALAIGVGIGLLNGLITLGLHIPSFIATLGMLLFWQAATLFMHGAQPQSFPITGPFATLTAGNIGVIPADFLWFVGLAVAFWALLQQHRLGNHNFAAGGGKLAAVATGVPVNSGKLLAFSLAGMCSAIAGILEASRIKDIALTFTAEQPLQAIAACVIGGVLLAGGRGTVLGIVLGAVLIYWIQDVLLLLGAPGFYLSAFVGTLIIAAGAIHEYVRTRRG
jgi:simple sugar transport system permease protein